jgi:outer membrane murein-binding lipoprotein Lpp
MTRANKALVILVVAALGLWGCAQGPAHSGANAERVKTLEGKVAKLEEDSKALTSARDQVRKKLAESEELRIKVQQELEQQQAALTKERDELRNQLTVRTTERDQAQTQFEQFRKGVRSLLLEADTAAATSGSAPPTASANENTTAGKS